MESRKRKREGNEEPKDEIELPYIPLEIMSHIFSYLDWSSIKNTRLSSKFFKDSAFTQFTTLLKKKCVKQIAATSSTTLFLLNDGSVWELLFGENKKLKKLSINEPIEKLFCDSDSNNSLFLLLSKNRQVWCYQTFLTEAAYNFTSIQNIPDILCESDVYRIEKLANEEIINIIVKKDLCFLFSNTGEIFLFKNKVVAKLPLKDVQDIFTNGYEIIFLLKDGTLKGCDNNTGNLIGKDGKSLPITTNLQLTTLYNPGKVKSIAFTHMLHVFLLEDGTVWYSGLPNSIKLPIEGVEFMVSNNSYVLFRHKDGSISRIKDYLISLEKIVIPDSIHIESIYLNDKSGFFIDSKGNVWKQNLSNIKDEMKRIAWLSNVKSLAGSVSSVDTLFFIKNDNTVGRLTTDDLSFFSLFKDDPSLFSLFNKPALLLNHLNNQDKEEKPNYEMRLG